VFALQEFPTLLTTTGTTASATPTAVRSSSGEISTGAKAGIGVVVPIFAIFCVARFVFLRRRRWKSSHDGRDNSPSAVQQQLSRQEGLGQCARAQEVHEKGDDDALEGKLRGRSEVNAGSPAAELGTKPAPRPAL
jgi:hypothetical protein